MSKVCFRITVSFLPTFYAVENVLGCVLLPGVKTSVIFTLLVPVVKDQNRNSRVLGNYTVIRTSLRLSK